MKEWIDDHIIGIVIFSCMIIAVSICSCVIYLDAIDDEYATVEGKIVSVDYLGKSEKYIYVDVFKLNFDNGESYVVEVFDDYDFTVNSKFIIKLFKDSPNDNWNIERMYKVPD